MRVAWDPGKRAPGRGAHWPDRVPDSSTLGEVLLFDGDVEQAWAEASRRRAPTRAVARRREAKRPRMQPDLAGEGERQIDVKKNQLRTARQCAGRAGGPTDGGVGRVEDFPPYVAVLPATHKPKRNLMALFDERGW